MSEPVKNPDDKIPDDFQAPKNSGDSDNPNDESDISTSSWERFRRNGYTRYYTKRTIWFLVTLVAAAILNFILPRLMPGDPLAAIMQRVAVGLHDAEQVRAIYYHYLQLFGLDRPVIEQFFIYFGNLFRGDLGLSFSRFPRPVSDIISNAVPWTIGLQLPAILTGWIIGNFLGAIAAYRRRIFDKIVMPASLFVSGIPAFGLAVILLAVFALNLGWFPVTGGYEIGLIPHFSWRFISSIIEHYHLPFWSIVLISIGGQALGMRSMSIYELNADYVRYSRFMGIKDSKIVRYVFRNAMLPQVTGLALSLGTMMGGAIVAEIIFSYPGLGTALLQAVREGDYPLVSGITLVITVMVLASVFLLEIIYGLIDPRVKTTQYE
ncbi:MAG: ABC transporter permease [Oscillospiraceae bacterium]|nr:ABC transporter permease [Oscillospiraceae bacterium]MCL2278778.1 ABC transporter permease [Oscillospiraceae bacterium]